MDILEVWLRNHFCIVFVRSWIVVKCVLGVVALRCKTQQKAKKLVLEENTVKYKTSQSPLK